MKKHSMPRKVFNALPKYVRLDGTALELLDERAGTFLNPENFTYYRINGAWGVDFKISDGKLFSIIPNVPRLHNKELIQITRKEFLKNN